MKMKLVAHCSTKVMRIMKMFLRVMERSWSPCLLYRDSFFVRLKDSFGLRCNSLSVSLPILPCPLLPEEQGHCFCSTSLSLSLSLSSFSLLRTGWAPERLESGQVSPAPLKPRGRDGPRSRVEPNCFPNRSAQSYNNSAHVLVLTMKPILHSDFSLSADSTPKHAFVQDSFADTSLDYYRKRDLLRWVVWSKSC